MAREQERDYDCPDPAHRGYMTDGVVNFCTGMVIIASAIIAENIPASTTTVEVAQSTYMYDGQEYPYTTSYPAVLPDSVSLVGEYSTSTPTNISDVEDQIEQRIRESNAVRVKLPEYAEPAAIDCFSLAFRSRQAILQEMQFGCDVLYSGTYENADGTS